MKEIVVQTSINGEDFEARVAKVESLGKGDIVLKIDGIDVEIIINIGEILNYLLDNVPQI
jgi:hypothetical protein